MATIQIPLICIIIMLIKQILSSKIQILGQKIRDFGNTVDALESSWSSWNNIIGKASSYHWTR